MNEICFGCDVKQTVSEEKIEELIELQLAMENDLVEESVRQERQVVCENCPWRQGATCGKCGCFYKFRIALSVKQCPIGKW